MHSLPPHLLSRYWESLSAAQKVEHHYRWTFWARDDQLPPETPWFIWLILAGRGWGKTRTGAEWIQSQAQSGRRRQLALIGASAADIRDIMIEGESGICTIAPPWFRPEYKPSLRKVVWPNGVEAITYSAEDPDQLRGPNIDGAWCDELAAWKYAQEAWDMLQFTLRSGTDPRAVVTTTPRPTKIIRDLVKDPMTFVTKGRTEDNRANLAPSFYAHITRKYAGTRLGRQELEAEILDDNPGALWKRTEIDEHRVIKHPDLARVVVGVDPAVTSGEESDETGIIGAGVGADGHGYVLEDASLRGTPHAWATAAVTLYHKLRADHIVAEVNNGGEMVEYTIHTIDPSVPVKMVHASRGKATRAEPISTAYERGGVSHVGAFPVLEDQLCSWTQGDKSPDRLDALVWALTDLDIGGTLQRIPLHDEPDPPGAKPEPSLGDAIRQAQADPFAWADRHGIW